MNNSGAFDRVALGATDVRCGHQPVRHCGHLWLQWSRWVRRRGDPAWSSVRRLWGFAASNSTGRHSASVSRAPPRTRLSGPARTGIGCWLRSEALHCP